MKTWQLGFRIPTVLGGDYTTPYTDLPPFQASQVYAFQIYKQIQDAHPNEEWRLVECI